MKLKRIVTPLLFILLGLAMLYYYQDRKFPPLEKAPPTPPEKPAKSSSTPSPTLIAPPEPQMAPILKRANRAFYGKLPTGVDDIQNLPLANSASKDWKKKLEKHLTRIGGDNLKTLQVKPEESYIIPDGSGGRLVERVAIKIESKEGEYTSFFAEVDSESGHVLKTWGVAIPEKRRHTH